MKVPLLVYLAGLTCTEDTGCVLNLVRAGIPAIFPQISEENFTHNLIYDIEPKREASFMLPPVKASPSFSQILPLVVRAFLERTRIGTSELVLDSTSMQPSPNGLNITIWRRTLRRNYQKSSRRLGSPLYVMQLSAVFDNSTLPYAVYM